MNYFAKDLNHDMEFPELIFNDSLSLFKSYFQSTQILLHTKGEERNRKNVPTYTTVFT